jgi:hypothetical protein
MRRKQKGPTLVESLIAIGVPADSVRSAADDFYKDRRLGEELVAQGVITRRQLSLALAHQAHERGEHAAATAWLHEAGIEVHRSMTTSIAYHRAKLCKVRQ